MGRRRRRDTIFSPFFSRFCGNRTFVRSPEISHSSHFEKKRRQRCEEKQGEKKNSQSLRRINSTRRLYVQNTFVYTREKFSLFILYEENFESTICQNDYSILIRALYRASSERVFLRPLSSYENSTSLRIFYKFANTSAKKKPHICAINNEKKKVQLMILLRAEINI